MLTKIGDVSEEEIVEAARAYLGMYPSGKVPFSDEGVIRYVVFEWLLERWCFIGIEN